MSDKLDRLRSFIQSLQTVRLHPAWTVETWKSRIEEAELTPDDERQIALLRRGHEQRAQRLWEQKDEIEAITEWRQFLALGPRETEVENEILALLKESHLPEANNLKEILNRRHVISRPQHGIKRFVWLGAILIGAVSIFVALKAIHNFDPAAAFRGVSIRESSQNLAFTVDTQGLTCQVKTIKCHLLTFPETRVAEVVANLVFPQNTLIDWAAEVMVLDAQKKVLATRSIVLRSSTDGPLLAGQTMNFFQQFDAENWSSRATEIFVKTTKMLTGNHAGDLQQPVVLVGADSLPDGIHIEGVLEKVTWRATFGKQIEDVDLQITNTGLKPISHLKMTAIWLGPNDTVWKIMPKTVVSRFLSPLSSGSKMMVHWTADFPVEIFPLENATPTLQFRVTSDVSP